MRSALGYLTFTKLKNQVKDLVRSPAKLIYVVVMAAVLALSVMGRSGQELEEPQPMYQLVALLTLFYSFTFLMVLGTGGDSAKTPMFTLSDVTILFPAPLHPHRVLVYGLMRQLGLSLAMALVLVFQYGWLKVAFGITWGHMALIILGFAVCIFFAAFCSMAIYVRTSGKDNATTVLRGCIFAGAVLYLVWMAYACRGALLPLLSGGQDFYGAMDSCAGFLSSFPGMAFPVAGWMAAVIGGIFAGDMGMVAAGAGLCVVLAAVLAVLIITCKNNYYEDVLETAEVAQSNVTAQKEGKFNELAPKNVKVGRTGLGKGWGASALYYKHRIENRRAGVFLLSNMSLVFVAIILFCAFIMGRSMEGEGSAALITTFAIATYMQIFSEGMGRFNLELINPAFGCVGGGYHLCAGGPAGGGRRHGHSPVRGGAAVFCAAVYGGQHFGGTGVWHGLFQDAGAVLLLLGAGGAGGAGDYSGRCAYDGTAGGSGAFGAVLRDGGAQCAHCCAGDVFVPQPAAIRGTE